MIENDLVRMTAVFLHVIGVAVYLGGSIVMEFVLTPAQKAIPPAQAQVMAQRSADRFLWLVWGSLTLIPAAGLLRLYSSSMQTFLFSSDLWGTEYGRTLMIKVLLWAALVINGLVITFVLRPRLSSRASAQMSAAETQQHQRGQLRAATTLGRITRADLAIAVVIALLGTSLRYGGIERVLG